MGKEKFTDNLNLILNSIIIGLLLLSLLKYKNCGEITVYKPDGTVSFSGKYLQTRQELEIRPAK